MDFVNAKDLEQCGELNKECTVLVLHEGAFHRMKMQDVLDYLAGAKVTTDTTLLLKDIPAEAKATGEAIRKAAPRNWLDNSDFTDLVAQAGIGGKHGSVSYAADRWKLTSGTVTYTAGTGLNLNGTITQVLEKAPTDGSCFVGMASGTATIALSGNTVTITSSGGVIKWAALYAENYTEATKPEYQPKGYGAELAECQRYFLHDVGRRCVGSILADSKVVLKIPTPVQFRTTPSVVALKLDNVVCNSSSPQLKALESVSNIEWASNCIVVYFNASLSAGELQWATVCSYSTSVDLVADL